MSVPPIKRLLREPLLHFVAIGALIYLVYVAIGDARRAPANLIIVSSQRIDQLSTQFRSIWKRSPTRKELDSLIEGDIREEVYYRMALALGLDKNDAIVRRRLRQKMEFLTETGAYLQEPTVDELKAYYSANKKAYLRSARLSFEQIYLGKFPDPKIIARALKVLRSDPARAPSTIGKRTLLPAELSLSLPNAVDGTFGRGFFKQLSKLSPGIWSGPVRSGFGVHLVRIKNVVSARTPPLQKIRDAVLRDWKFAKAKERRELDYAKRRKRFVVEIHRRGVQSPAKQ